MNICHDNILYYYMLHSKKIAISVAIISTVIVLFVLFIYFVKKKRRKKRNKKDYIKAIITLVILLIISFSIYIGGEYIKSHTHYEYCLEEEEQLAIEEADYTPPKYIEVKQEEKKEIEETIEIVEGEEILDEENLIKDNAIYFLNVGAGTESFILEDQGHFGLIDTSYNSKAKFILKQLKKLGAEELDFIIITHSHLDHMGGYSKIMSSIPVKTLYIKNPGNVNSDYVPTYLSMINEAEEKGTTICDVKDELCKSFSLGNIEISLYNTDFYTAKGIDGEDRSRIENVNSIGVLAKVNNRKIYFASDIGDYSAFKAETIVASEIGDIDVYKVAHHGYVSYNNGLVPLSYLKPEYNIVTNNKELSLNAIKRIQNTSPDYKKTYFTTNGTITLHVAGNGELEFTQ